MSDNIIKLLPDAIANQIAAGEVVQRPSSVVKELMENSIDSGATHVQLIIKDAGRSLIQVVDNGKGMNAFDARMSFERHATSKIAKAEDLFALHSFGFRGEALASIAAVAQVELKTKPENQELGTYIQIEGSEFIKTESCATTTGTSIQVKNLFYNIPARRNFLKSNSIEFKHILEEFTRIALSYPAIGFSLFNDQHQTYNLAPKKITERIVDVLGNAYRGQLINCEEETERIKIKGYIGKPDSAKKARGDQYFFVNQRFIKSPYLHHAVLNAYHGLIPNDTHPFYVIMIDIDPQMIDVNVHPTKTEIKFDDEKTVYGLIAATVRGAIAKHHVAPPIDFDADINIEKMLGFSDGVDRNVNTNFNNSISSSGSSSYRPQHFPSGHNSNSDQWEKLYDGINKERQEEQLTFSSAINHEDVKVSNAEVNNNTFQLLNKYIVTTMRAGLVIIDQQVAHERILYERFNKSLKLKKGASQQLLFPQQIELSAAQSALVMSMEAELQALGFMFSPFGPNTIQINGLPAEFEQDDAKALFEGLLEQYQNNYAQLKLDKNENLARALATRSAVKQGHALTLIEMNAMIGQLFACENPQYNAYGKKTMSVLKSHDLESLF